MIRIKGKEDAAMTPGIPKRIFVSMLILALACLLFGCRGKHTEPTVIDVPVSSEGPATAFTPVPTAAPTPAPDTLEAKILAGEIYALNGGAPLGRGWGGEAIDLDCDGAPDALTVSEVGGGPTFCISGEPFMDVGASVYIASLDGKTMVFITEKAGEDGFRVFYPDREGNLFCRLFGVARAGSVSDFTIRGSLEEYVRNGLDIMLYNPRIYSGQEGAERKVELDMDGDGSRDILIFDSEALSLNGVENDQILSTTMPRFIYDPEKDTIILYGSAGDYALRVFIENGEPAYDISYASLL
jgi:hypothetical protein